MMEIMKMAMDVQEIVEHNQVILALVAQLKVVTTVTYLDQMSYKYSKLVK